MIVQPASGRDEIDSTVLALDKGEHCFALLIRRMLSLSAMGPLREDYLEGFSSRLVDFLTCLINPQDERFTYDLRVTSHPDPTFITHGRISIAILCKVAESPADKVLAYAHEFAAFAEACFDEYEFELSSSKEIEALLRPFPIAHLLGIRRRCSREALDTLQSGQAHRKPLGFTSSQGVVASESQTGGESTFHIFPFVPKSMELNKLFRLLLLERTPVAISVRLKPTRLSREEEEFLEQQITTCERYAQASLGQLPEDLQALFPPLREQARSYEQYQSRILFGLRDNAALMTVEIAAADPIAHIVPDAVGSLLTQPAGGNVPIGQSHVSYLAGGYEIVDLCRIPGAREAFEGVNVNLPPHPSVPGAARRLLYLFDSVEAASAFRLPPATLDPPVGLEIRQWRELPAPQQPAETGVLLGAITSRTAIQPIRLGSDDRRRHMYCVGQTGTGKTTLLKTMILDDIKSGAGLCVIDPHGDLYKELLGTIPKNRTDDVVLLDPTDTEWPVGVNVLECGTESQRHFIIQEFVGILTRIVEDEYGLGALKEFVGPVFFQHMRMNLLLVMSNPDDPGTILEFYQVFREPDYWKRWLPLRTADSYLENWTKQVLSRTNYLHPGSENASMGSYISSKFEGFLFDPILRNIFGQKRSTINFREIMDTGKILLVNLAKGELTEANSRFLGMFLLAKLQAAAMSRVDVPLERRQDFYVYVDEFQSIATQNFISLLSEGRKFGLSLILANQFVSQIKDPRIRESIFGNVGTLICFRLGQKDAEDMEHEFYPALSRSDLINLPNWNAYISTLVNGQAIRPFNIHTIRDTALHDASCAMEVRERCRKQYGRNRKVVENEVGAGLMGECANADRKEN